MQWVSISDLQARLDPKYRLAYEKQHLQRCIAQAQLEQRENHHTQQIQLQHEKMNFEREMRGQEAQVNITRERIAGQNALALSRQDFFLSQLGKNSDLIQTMYDTQHKREEEWSNNFAQIMGQLLTIEADTIRQKTISKQNHVQEMEKLQLQHTLSMEEKRADIEYLLHIEQAKADIEKRAKKLQHRQELEKLVLQYNLTILEKFIDSNLQDWRITYDKTCDLIFRLVEQLLGLGNQQVSEADMQRMYEDALRQAYR